ncbi:MAG: hypothetical protein PSV35_08135, partial [bacterium]|nr:hypothetical protein [bacterium]
DNLTFQTMHLIRSVLFEALIPALVFASLVFFPLGVGLAAIGATIALAICTNMIINATWKPEEQQLKTFPEEEYITFCAAQHKKTKSIGFFAPGYSPETGKENKTAYDDGGEITPESGYY